MTTRFPARYYDGRTSSFTAIRVDIEADGSVVAEPPVFAPLGISRVRVEVAPGRLPHRLQLPDGALVEVDYSEVFLELLRRHGVRTGFVRTLEQHWSYALAGLAAVIAAVAAGAHWGIPVLSAWLAPRIPTEIAISLGQETLRQLDSIAFSDSTLPSSRRGEIQAGIDRLMERTGARVDYWIEWRAGGPFGANAFALPDGSIVVTDELVALAERDEQIQAVVLHEIGHVVHRHGLRAALNHAGLATLAAVLIGDVQTAGGLIVFLPSVLMESSYSRAMEWEADTYALERMQAAALAPRHFADMLDRLERCALQMPGPESEEKPASVPECPSPQQAGGADSASENAGALPDSMGWNDYLGSHPTSARRIARFRDADANPSHSPQGDHQVPP